LIDKKHGINIKTNMTQLLITKT